MELTVKQLETLWGKVNKNGPAHPSDESLGCCWIWNGCQNKHGYGKVKLNKKTLFPHRVSFFLHNGIWPEPMCLHSCDRPLCVNPFHLRAGTQQENIVDRDSRGHVSRGDSHYSRVRPELLARGEKMGAAKATEDVVRSIRLEYKPRVVTFDMLAQKYGLSQAVVCAIVNRKSWKHVE